MSDITLYRIDAARRMRRFYKLAAQPALFGGWSLVREWGRIGRAGQLRIVPYPTPAEAEVALNRFRRVKERRRYYLLTAGE